MRRASQPQQIFSSPLLARLFASHYASHAISQPLHEILIALILLTAYAVITESLPIAS